MIDGESFASRIRERYPRGLTGIVAVGGTRTTYMMDQNRRSDDPGKIDYQQYGASMLERIQQLLRDYFFLGGQNLIVPVLSYQSVEFERGSEYAELTSSIARELMSGPWMAFYEEQSIDPYFAGIDTLIRFPDRPSYHSLGVECQDFNQRQTYLDERRHKVIWEIAPIPLYSIWRAHEVMGPERRSEMEQELEAASDLQLVHDILYKYYAHAVYGTELPMPNFYLGSNRNGDIKLRAMLPIALTCGGPMRLFFTPYPTFFVTCETLRAILEDLAFGKRLYSNQVDYSGKMSPELLEAEYVRVQQLSADPGSTLGLLREHGDTSKHD